MISRSDKLSRQVLDCESEDWCFEYRTVHAVLDFMQYIWCGQRLFYSVMATRMWVVMCDA